MTRPPSSCRQMTVPETHGSSKISDIVARFLGSSSSMRLMIYLLSRGRSRSSRHGPLMTSGFFSTSVGAVLAAAVAAGCSVLVETAELSGTVALSGALRSEVDLDCAGSGDFVISVPGVGAEAKSLYELSVMRGIFQGNRRRDMQQKMIASDQISAGWGSYLRSS